MVGKSLPGHRRDKGTIGQRKHSSLPWISKEQEAHQGSEQASRAEGVVHGEAGYEMSFMTRKKGVKREL